MCAIETIDLDAEVFCMAQGIEAQNNCRVQWIRRIFKPVVLYDVGNWDLNLVPSAVISFFGTHFGTVGRGIGVSFAEMFLEDPSTTFTYHLHRDVDLWNIYMEIFEDRMSMFSDTLVASTINPQSVLGAGERDTREVWNTTALLEVPLLAIYVLDAPLNLNLLPFHGRHDVCGPRSPRTAVLPRHAAGARLGRRAGPGFTVLCTPGPVGNSPESSEETSKRPRRARVGVVDVRAGSYIGRVALAPEGIGERVRKGRWYE